MNISCRQATDRDFGFLWKLHQATMQSYVDKTWGWDEAWQKRYFTEQFDPTHVEIVERGERPVGCVSIFQREGALLLAAIEIAPRQQSCGIGTYLVERLLERAANDGLTVELQVLKVNPARRLYERLGFAKVGESETHYIMENREPGAPRHFLRL